MRQSFPSYVRLRVEKKMVFWTHCWLSVRLTSKAGKNEIEKIPKLFITETSRCNIHRSLSFDVLWNQCKLKSTDNEWMDRLTKFSYASWIVIIHMTRWFQQSKHSMLRPRCAIQHITTIYCWGYLKQVDCFNIFIKDVGSIWSKYLPSTCLFSKVPYLKMYSRNRLPELASGETKR